MSAFADWFAGLVSGASIVVLTWIAIMAIQTWREAKGK